MTITCGKCGNTFKSFKAWAEHPCEAGSRKQRYALPLPA